MRQKPAKTARLLAIILLIIALYLILALLFYMFQAGTPFNQLNIFIKPGAFLFMSFSLAAFYIPVFVLICSWLLLKRPFLKKKLVILNLSMIPFITFTLFLKIVTGAQYPDLIINTLIEQSVGKVMGSMLFFVLFLFEVALIIKYSLGVKQQAYSRYGNAAGARVRTGAQSSPENDKRAFILELNRLQQAQAANQQAKAPVKSTQSKAKAPVQEPANKPSQVKSLVVKNPAKPGLQNVQAPVKTPLNVPALQPPAVKLEPVKEQKVFAILDKDNCEDVEVLEAVIEDDDPVDEAEAPEEIQEDDELYEDMETDDEVSAADPDPAVPGNLPGAEAAQQPAERKRSAKEYYVPVDGILMDYDDGEYWKIDSETSRSANVLMDTLKEFKIAAEVTGIRKGPVITMFEILPAPGVKLSRIVNLADNIALRLAAATVRIVAPIPGKHAVGIEVPNKERAIVSFKELISLDIVKNKKQHIPIVIGKDITGEALIIDLVQTPHLLIAGATGSGKSVCVNSIISSVLYSRSPEQVKLLLIDPKIVELKFYNDIPHLLTPVVTSPKKAFQALQYCLFEMERRYSLLDAVGVRDINSFNKKVVNKKLATTQLPYLVIIIDEFADLIANTGKEMEATIARLAAMSRAVGLHLVLATQRPSVDVITGLIKANIPSRIAFMVASKFDSRIIIDSVGAEKLLGRGDMLFSSAWDPVPVRIQGAYLCEEEVEALTAYVKTLGEPDYLDEEMFYEDEEESGGEDLDFGANDPLMEKALEIVIAKGKASASYLQRKLKIGYNRAARLVEEMELRGIVGPPNGSKPRELLHIPDRKTKEYNV